MSAPPADPEPPSAEALAQDYVRALMAPDGDAARRLVTDALASGVPAEDLCLRVIAPAMAEVGRRWGEGQITIAQEHLATQVSQRILGSLGDRMGEASRVGAGRSAVVAATPGELHALGSQMVAAFLETQGWRVLALGPDSPVRASVSLAEQHGAELVALSTAMPEHLLSVTHMCEQLRRLNHRPFIVVGGRAYEGQEAHALALGADAFAADPAALLELLAERFAAD